jgi:diguanylate cyclase (GGDEF)-like protein
VRNPSVPNSETSVWGRTLAVGALGALATLAAVAVPRQAAQRNATAKVERQVAIVGASIVKQTDAQRTRLEALARQTSELSIDPDQRVAPLAVPKPSADGLYRSVWLIGPPFGEADADNGFLSRYRMAGKNEQTTNLVHEGMAIGADVFANLTKLGLPKLPGPLDKTRLVNINPDQIVGKNFPSTDAAPRNASRQQTWALATPVPKVGWALAPIEPAGLIKLFDEVPNRDVLDISVLEGGTLTAPALAQIRPTNPPKPEDARWTSKKFNVLGSQFTTIIGHDKNYGATSTNPLLTFAIGGALTTLASALVFLRLHRRNRHILETALRDARHIARTDELTGLGNRLAINEILDGAPAGERVALLLCDLDRFKLINDARGHDAGDGVLRDVATRLQAACSSFECTEAVVARFGGDEFVVILRNDDAQRCVEVAEAMVAKLTRPFTVGNDAVVIGASVGISRTSADAQSPTNHSELLREADAAMYVAKRSGGNRVVVAGEESRSRGVHQLDTEIALRAALGTDQIQAWFQPIVDTNEEICALEALVRWKHPERGLVSPGQFLPAAKDAGLLAEISTIVLAQSCFAVADWNRQRIALGQPPLLVHVNCVEEQLTDPGFAEVVSAYVQASELDPGCLLLEISEETAFERLPATLPTLDLIRAQGVRFSLDDFGFGNSSLTMVRRLGNIAELKIDKSIVDSLAPDATGDGTDLAADTAVIRAVTDFAQTQGIAVVAEGIEHRSQFEQLRIFGVDMFQGFYFHRPQPPDIVRTLIIGELQSTDSLTPA